LSALAGAGEGEGEGVEVLLVGFWERVEVLLGGLDLGVAHPLLHGSEVGAFGQEPGARSQEAWAWRRSWMRTGKSTPLAVTAGIQTRVRKVLREIGVPVLVVNSRWSRPTRWVWMWSATASSQSSSMPNVRSSLSLG
jgi:hypothetical protein